MSYFSGGSSYHYSLFLDEYAYDISFNNFNYFSCSYDKDNKKLDSYAFSYNVNIIDYPSLVRSNIIKKQNQDFSLYPLAVRYAIPGSHFYVIERPPFEIDIDYSKATSYRTRVTPKQLQNKTISIPWTLTAIYCPPGEFPTMWMWLNNRPLMSEDDILIPSWLPNVSNSLVCLGQDSTNYLNHFFKNDQDAPEYNINNIYNYLFNAYFSGWNTDLSPNFPINNFIISKIDEIVKNTKAKDLPNHFAESPDRWSWNNSTSMTNRLYLHSRMNFDEINQYIETLKESYVPNEFNVSQSYNANTFKNLITSCLHQYVSYFEEDQEDEDFYYGPSVLKNSKIVFLNKLNSYFIDSIHKIKFNVQVTDMDIPLICKSSNPHYGYYFQTILSNPYLISKILETIIPYKIKDNIPNQVIIPYSELFNHLPKEAINAFSISVPVS